MQNWRIKTSLYLNFLFFAIMMSSDGILILQVQKHYGVAASVAGLLGGFRDMSVAVAALLLAAYVARIGYKRSMLIALAMVALICLLVPVGNSFTMIEMLFLVTGVAFALMKELHILSDWFARTQHQSSRDLHELFRGHVCRRYVCRLLHI